MYGDLEVGTRGLVHKDLDFGFGFLPILGKMGEIREFRCFSVVRNLNFQKKIDQILNFQKKLCKIPQIQ
jgi:hypothetical protein